MAPLSWPETRQRLAEDRVRLRALLGKRFGRAPRTLIFQPSYQCVLLHRLAHHFWRRGQGLWARLFTQLNAFATGADIHPHCDLGGGLLIPHPVALTASGHAGRDLTMMPLSGIGMLPRGRDVGAGPGLPLLGDGVWLGAGSGVLGPVRVGDACRIEAGAALTHDAPGDSSVRMAVRAMPAATAASVAPSVSAPPATAADANPSPACRHRQHGSTWRAVRSDIDRYMAVREPGSALRQPSLLRQLGCLLTHEVMVLALHRLAHALHGRGWRRTARVLAQLNLLVFRAWIAPSSCIGDGCFLPHPAGAVIVARAGEGLTMYARSLCLPSAVARDGASGPRLGDKVVLAGMAAAIGPISVGDGVRIGFNVHVRGDVAAGQSVAGAVMRTVLEPNTPLASGKAGVVRAGAAPAWSQSWRRWREDRARVRALACSADRQALPPLWPALLCALLFRLSHHAHCHGRMRWSRWCWGLNVRLTGADMDPRCEIGGGLLVLYPMGVSVHAGAGDWLTLGALTSLGGDVTTARCPWDDCERPSLGDGVTLEAHASVHGAVRIGTGVRLGPGCKVGRDVPEGLSLDMPAPRRQRQRTAALQHE